MLFCIEVKHPTQGHFLPAKKGGRMLKFTKNQINRYLLEYISNFGSNNVKLFQEKPYTEIPYTASINIRINF